METTIAWELSPATGAWRNSRRDLWAALASEAAAGRDVRGDVRIFLADLLARVPRAKLGPLLAEFPATWADRTEVLLNDRVVEDLIAQAVPARQLLTLPLESRARAGDPHVWQAWLSSFRKESGQNLPRSVKTAALPRAATFSFVATTYNNRTEDSPCLGGSCSERDVRAWRLAARRWFGLASAVRTRLLEKWPKEKWPLLAKTADLGFAEAEAKLSQANNGLGLDQLAAYVAAQKSARLAVHGFQLGQEGDLGGLLFDLVEPTFGRWGPITGFGNATLGFPCTGLLDVCTDQDVYGWEYVAKSHNGSAAKLREAVVIVFGEDAAGWPPLVQLGEFSFTEAQAVLNGDLGWSDSAKVYSFADAQALVKDALEIWTRAIAAKTGKDVKYEAPDPNKDPNTIPEPHVPKLPDLFGGLRRLAYVVGGVAVVGTAAVVYVVTRKTKGA